MGFVDINLKGSFWNYIQKGGLILIGQLFFLSCDHDNQSPAGRFSSEPEFGNLATTFYFDASASTDADNSSFSLLFRWDFNSDGVWETFFTHDPIGGYKYVQSGTYTVLLEVKDPFENISLTSQTVTVSDKNDPPLAELNILPPRASLGTTVLLDGSKSTDDIDDTEDLLFRWDIFSDGNWDSEYLLQRSFNFVFPKPGNYSVTMEILDSQGARSAISSKIEILESPNPYSYLIDPRDQHYYSTVKIGNQWIMAHNLQYGVFVQNQTTPMNNGICEYFGYDDNSYNSNEFGGLYLWDEVLAYTDKEKGGGVCPPGWHIPTDGEWTEFEIEMGMNPSDNNMVDYSRAEKIGSLLRMKSISGFEAGFWGWRYHERTFYGLSLETRFWTSTIDSKTGSVYVRGLSSTSSGIFRGTMPNNSALSVRCFKNQ